MEEDLVVIIFFSKGVLVEVESREYTQMLRNIQILRMQVYFSYILQSYREDLYSTY